MSDLSELSLAYLDYLDDIRAGERALADDAARILALVGAERSGTCEVSSLRLKRRWSPNAAVEVILRLKWELPRAWPVVEVEARSDTKLMDGQFLSTFRAEQVDRNRLREAAETEVARVWDENVERVEAWLDTAEVRTRIGAVELMVEVWRRLRPLLRPQPQAFTHASGKVGGGPFAPAFVEWKDVDPSSKKPIYFEVLYQLNGAGTRPGGLHLTCFNGEHVRNLLADTPIVGRYDGHPILATWTDRLDGIAAGHESATTAAQGIADAVAAIYHKYRARLDAMSGRAE